jgi:pyrimidine-nucleoside phosphorylase
MELKDIINKKNSGDELGEEEIAFFISEVVSGSCSDEMAVAFLKAAYDKGLNITEATLLTKAMLSSGKTLDTKDLSGIKADKHSTGGVGDKTSIILCPLMSAMGIKMPMISGRGLGHTGGSLDKIESIPNFNTTLSTNEMLSLLKGQGVFMGGQTDEIAPADKRLYALRHESGTIDSIPLIAASIMSKKLSEGLDGLVLDVKTGSGAFMKSLDDSRELARTMISIGNSMGVKTIAVISDMDQPLGRTVGNALEIKECISAMRGRWADDLRELTLSLGARILQMSDALAEDAELGAMNTFGRKSYFLEQLEFIDKGDVFKKFAEIVDAQGGDPEVVFNPSMLPSASHIHEIKADSNGTIRKMDARAVGIAANLLGAGRMTSKDDIDHAAGIIINQKTGAEVQKGDLIALMHTNDPGQINDAEEAFREGLTIADRAAATRPLIHEVVM